MSGRIRSSVIVFLGGLLLGGIEGCSAGDKGLTEASPGTNSSQSAPSSPGQKNARTGADQAKQNESSITTPARQIDTEQLNKTVKEEVKGGEATEGPSPFQYLWAASKRELIKDEPLIVKVPAGLQPLTPKIYVPVSNPLTKGKYELGRQLYFDPRVSLDGTVSCATCHNPAQGWTDGMAVSIGIAGQAGTRSAPSVINAAYGKSMFWDGRAPSLEGQAQGPIQNKIEMGNQSYKEIIERLAKIPAYSEQFEKVFGSSVTLDGMAKAIATFERVAALSGNSPYDKYKVDNNALSDSEKRGMILFGLTKNTNDDFKTDVVSQKGNCTDCHVGFNFTDEEFHNLGIGFDPKTGKFADVGRWAIDPIGAKSDVAIGSFKTPTVREIAHSGPYMHDGSLTTLEQVIEHYDKGGTPNPALDPKMKKLNLTAQEKADLVAFMKALSGETKTLAELLPALPPGPDGKSPDPSAFLKPPAKLAAAVIHPVVVK